MEGSEGQHSLSKYGAFDEKLVYQTNQFCFTDEP